MFLILPLWKSDNSIKVISMKIVIDEKACLKHKMTLNEALIALAARTENIEDNLKNMCARQMLTETQEGYQITQHWSDVLDEVICDSSQDCTKTEEELLELTKKVRELFPQGKQKDKYGRDTPYYYRCNNKEVKDKLKKFFTLFGNYSDEEILDATKRYVASFRGQYWQNGILRLAKYFILKDQIKPTEDGNHVEQVSDLLTFLENKESEGEEGAVTTSDDWMINSRN